MHPRLARSGVDETYLARPMRQVLSPPPTPPPQPRKCPYCDNLASAVDLTCGGATCLARQARFEKAIREMCGYAEEGA